MATPDPRALLQKAEKTKSSAESGLSLFGGRQDKLENAAELYVQAANAFRMQKQDKEAGLAFERAAEIQEQCLREPDDAANTMTEAFKAYRKTAPEDAARCLESAIRHYTMKGNFRRAATWKQNIAELFEVELDDQKRAIEAYETAADWYEQDNAEALANKLYLKVGDLAALQGEYYKAIDRFERVAKSSINKNLMKWSVREYLFKAGISHMATNDIVGLRNALDSYRDLDNTFADSREYLLLKNLATAIEDNNQNQFSESLYQFDQVSKLDNWKTTLLLRIKNNIENQEDDFA